MAFAMGPCNIVYMDHFYIHRLNSVKIFALANYCNKKGGTVSVITTLKRFRTSRLVYRYNINMKDPSTLH